MSCPKCENDEWKSASFVYKSGISNITLNTSTIGAGAGIGTGGIGIGGGMASSNSNGTQQSRLSLESTPPVEPKDIAGTIFWIIAIILSIIVGSAPSNPVVWILLISVCILYVKNLAPKYQKHLHTLLWNYNKKLSRWEATRVCQRCGQLYFPEDFIENTDNT